MLKRPFDTEFFDWIENDSNIPKMQEALSIFPDLIDIRSTVRKSIVA